MKPLIYFLRDADTCEIEREREENNRDPRGRLDARELVVPARLGVSTHTRAYTVDSRSRGANESESHILHRDRAKYRSARGRSARFNSRLQTISQPRLSFTLPRSNLEGVPLGTIVREFSRSTCSSIANRKISLFLSLTLSTFSFSLARREFSGECSQSVTRPGNPLGPMQR